MTLTLPKTLPGSTWVPMPSLVLIGPAVRPAIARIHTDKQTDKHNALYMVDLATSEQPQSLFGNRKLMFKLPLNIIGHYRVPQKAFPCVKLHHMSHRMSKWIRFCCRWQQEYRREGKERKCTKSHKIVIFFTFLQMPPVNRFQRNFAQREVSEHNHLCQLWCW